MRSVKLQKQLSIFLSNRPGELSRMCGILREAKVNMHALSVHDAIDHCLVRIVVDNDTKAILLLEREDWHVTEQEVLVVELENIPGALGRVSQKLAEADINIHYAYASATDHADYASMVIKTENNDRAIETLR